MANFDTVLAAYRALPQRVQSLLLSTINADGTPHASYAPFVVDAEQRFYVITSGLSSHTQNLLRTGQVSLLLIEDEAAAQQVFTRQRIAYDGQATRLERDSAEWVARADQLEDRFGEIIQMLRSLADFQIFCITPRRGRFVMGFGAAYEVNPDDMSQLIPRAIQPPKP
jgi:putative heme iron utilization protein